MIKLLPNQENAKRHLEHWKVGALFMDAGTGKTRVACELINSVPDIDLIVWFGPLRSIKPKDNIPSIIDEINKWGGFKCENTIFVGVESIQLSDRIYVNLNAKLKQAKKPFIVVDESLKIKNFDAKRTKRILALGEYAEYKLILNGTPFSKNLLDIWAQMEFISPKILQMPLSKFKNTFCKYTTITKCIGGRQLPPKEYIIGYENIDYLYSLVRHYVFRCNLQLNILAYYRDVRYKIDDETIEKYNFLKKEYLDNDTLILKNNNIFIEMTQKMQHLYCCTEDKFNVVNNILANINAEQTIIFCKYIKSREECEKRYPNILVLSYQKDSFSLNLQKYRYTIYFDKIWDLALREQSLHRSFRTGQEKDCFFWDMTGNVGLEKLIDKNIEKKISMTEYFRVKTKEELNNVL